MLKQLIIFVIITFFNQLFAQNSLINVDEPNKDIGTQENIYKVKADYIIQNNQAKNLYLLRADALKGITIRAAKKTIKPGDTTIIMVEFIPQQTGKFNEAINLVTSADGVPFKITLSIQGLLLSTKLFFISSAMMFGTFFKAFAKRKHGRA